jgi:hypothetical protein
MNFIPEMDEHVLLNGYKSIIKNIYTAKPYYKRIRMFLKNFSPSHNEMKKLEFGYLKAFFKSMFFIGLINKGRSEYWKLIIWTLFNRPKLFPNAMTFAVYGYHYRTVYGLKKR